MRAESCSAQPRFAQVPTVASGLAQPRFAQDPTVASGLAWERGRGCQQLPGAARLPKASNYRMRLGNQLGHSGRSSR